MDMDRKISVIAAAILLVADNVGTGILALPGQAAALGGRAVGIALIIAFAPLCWYAGVALHRAATLIERHNAERMLSSDAGGAEPSLINDLFGLAAALYGNQSFVARFTAFLFYTTLFLQMASYLVVLSQTLQKIIHLPGGAAFCRPWAGLATAMLLLFSNQFSTMAAVARGPAGISVLGVVAVVIICVIYAAKDEAAPTTSPPPPHEPESLVENALDRAAATGGVIFAEGVTMLLLNSRQALADPSRVGTALGLALSGMCVGFTVVVMCSGEHPPPFLLDAIPHSAPTYRHLAASLLFVHVAISYAISSVALCSAILRLPLMQREDARRQHTSSTIKPVSSGCSGGHRESGGEAGAGVGAPIGDDSDPVNSTIAAPLSCCWQQLEWALLTSFVMLMAWLLANAAPFFAALIDLIGSLNLCTFFLPSLFLRRAHELTRTPLPLWERALTAALMLASVGMTAAGITGSIYGIVRSWRHYGPPFACHAGL